MKYYIVAGEASGDLHGSNLMKGLYAKDSEAEIRFWGGELMDKVFHDNRHGEGLVQDYRKGAIIGFTQVLFHATSFLNRIRRCKTDILQWNPDVVILIDYPGFNFKIAEFSHRHGIRTFYYIAPKVWASREGRVSKIKKYVDSLFIVFPFEIPYFRSKGVKFIYKGNPLIDAIDNSDAMNETRKAFLDRNGIEDKPSIALLAGSRSGEIATMMPVFMEFADKMRKIPAYSDYLFLVAAAPGRQMKDYQKYVDGRESYVKVLFGQSYAVVKNSLAAAINSGTASLEAALIGTPQVVGYKGAEINYLIARMIIKIKFISLGNLILNKLCFRELIQYYFTADNVLEEIIRLIEDKKYRADMIEDYGKIRVSLGNRGASEAVAEAMIGEIRKK